MTKPYNQIAKCPKCETPGHIGVSRVVKEKCANIGVLQRPVNPLHVSAFRVIVFRAEYTRQSDPYSSETFFCGHCDAEFDTITEFKAFDKAKDYIAWLCEDHALDQRTQGEEYFGCGDDELGEMYVDDAENAARIAAFIGQEDYAEALNMLRSLDTAERDSYDDKVWAFLQLQEQAAQ